MSCNPHVTISAVGGRGAIAASRKFVLPERMQFSIRAAQFTISKGSIVLIYCSQPRLHFTLLARKIFCAQFFARLKFYVSTGALFSFVTGRDPNLCYLVDSFLCFLFVSAIFYYHL